MLNESAIYTLPYCTLHLPDKQNSWVCKYYLSQHNQATILFPNSTKTWIEMIKPYFIVWTCVEGQETVVAASVSLALSVKVAILTKLCG